MTRYKHTQVGSLMIYVLVITTVLLFASLAQTNMDPLLIVITAVLLLTISSFTALTITIDEKFLRASFRYRIIQKKIPLKEIAAVQRVKNKWYHGWGVRVWLWPYMHIYNVSGFDAVEIHMKNGMIYRIGTDEPQKLEEVLLETL